MAKKSKNKNKPPKIVVCNAFRCNICGKVVPSIHRSRHLIVAHKLDGSAVKSLFTNLGTPFRRNKNAEGAAMLREYKRNMTRPKSESVCGSNPIEPKPFKIIYTPMGNKR